MRIVDIPNDWDPLDHQLPSWHYMMDDDEPGKRSVKVWHRRAGKDSSDLNMACAKSFRRKGVYWHMLPEKEQARKAIWNGQDKQGRRIIDQVFPMGIRKRTVDDEMRIELVNGSQWQVVGSDNYNSLVGTNPIGIVFSEYSVGDPAAWDFLRPILRENGGWAAFNYTPRGRNHGDKMFQMAMRNPKWFAELLTVDDTGLLTQADIDEERASGMDDDMIQQEYYCSFMGVRQGSIFGQAMKKMRDEGRIASFPYDRRYPVQTFWDIGHRDATGIICHQEIGGWHRFIDAYEMAGQDTAHFVHWLKQTGYLFGKHYLPHDAKNVVLASASNPLGANVYDQLWNLGLRDLEMVPRTPDKWTAVNATRLQLDNVQINLSALYDPTNDDGPASGTAHLVNALESYRKKYDEKLKVYSRLPVHDWASTLADAAMQWAQGYKGQGTGMQFTAPPNLAGAPQRPGRIIVPPTLVTVGNRRAGY